MVEVHRHILLHQLSYSTRNPHAMRANGDDDNILNCYWKMGSACHSKSLALSVGEITSLSCVADM